MLVFVYLNVCIRVSIQFNKTVEKQHYFLVAVIALLGRCKLSIRLSTRIRHIGQVVKERVPYDALLPLLLLEVYPSATGVTSLQGMREQEHNVVTLCVTIRPTRVSKCRYQFLLYNAHKRLVFVFVRTPFRIHTIIP